VADLSAVRVVALMQEFVFRGTKEEEPSAADRDERSAGKRVSDVSDVSDDSDVSDVSDVSSGCDTRTNGS